MTDSYTVTPDPADPPDDQVRVFVWLCTSDGAVQFGSTFERGPFDDLERLSQQLRDALPWPRVEPWAVRQRIYVQLPLFAPESP
jgi:hypothetical protein